VWLNSSSIIVDVAKLARGRQSQAEDVVGNSEAARALAAVTENELAKRRVELENAKETTAQAGARINKQAVAQCERGESEMKELTTKREALESEKAAIEELISDLDQQKGKALINTWQVVNNHFGNIFRALLPNVDARLEPAAGLTAQEGLELKVAFGGKWKESLSELSGGQKSLLALSLILALLKYKPAPFYILDEVDAALDISHTKNIGHMIKTVFPDSQFIIVSLKEGMFQNANVLFRTRFQDGTSMVTRSMARTEGVTAAVVDAENDASRNDRNRTERARVDLPEHLTSFVVLTQYIKY
jgi:structural maintenance of chromosome 2